MKPYSSTLFLSLILSTAAPAFASEDCQRNIEALKSIPLVAGYETRNEQEERYITDVLKGIFTSIQNESANQDKSLNRGTHAKGSCFDGELTLLSRSELKEQFHYPDEIIDRLKNGIFSRDKGYPAQIRFGNGKGERNPDRVADVRSLSFSLDLKGDQVDHLGESRQDYSANSSPEFAVKNIQEFYQLMKAERTSKGRLSYFPNLAYVREIKRAFDLLNEYQRTDSKSYTTEHYWANVPYTHGMNEDGTPKEIAKIKMVPCDGSPIQRESSEGKADDYLQKDIEDHAQNGTVCFNLQVQLFDADVLKQKLGPDYQNWSKADWIENGGSLWPEEILPYYTVARLQIPKKVDAQGNPISPKVSCDDRYLNPRLHSNLENMPIGSLARVRAEVEENSRCRRQSDRNPSSEGESCR